MRKNIFGFLTFAATIVIIVVILRIINWLPMAVQKDTLRRYGSVEEIRSRLNIKDIFVPSYFPLSLRWPPSELLAQGRPFKAIRMEFKDINSGDTALIISQVTAGSNFGQDGKIKILQIKEKANYPLKERTAALTVGVCKNDEPCSQITWNEEKYTITVTMRSTPFDLIKVADSMVH